MSDAEPPMPPRGLVHHDPRVRQGVALALGAGAQQELAHRGRQAHADGGDVVGDVVHRVVDRHAGVDRAAGGVDVEEDVGLGVLGATAAAAARRSRWRSGRAPRSRGRRCAPAAAAGRCGRRGRSRLRHRSSAGTSSSRSRCDPSRNGRALPRVRALFADSGFAPPCPSLRGIREPPRIERRRLGAERATRRAPRPEVTPTGRSGEPVAQGDVHVGVVEQVEVAGPGQVQLVGAGEQPGMPSRPAGRRRLTHEQVAEEPADRVPRRAAEGGRRPGGSGRGAAAARRRPARRQVEDADRALVEDPAERAPSRAAGPARGRPCRPRPRAARRGAACRA